jgi:hypothetical protein
MLPAFGFRALWAGFIEQGYTTDGQENDCLWPNASAGTDQCMSQFMEQNAAEYQADERENALGVSMVLRRGFGKPHESDEEDERQMNAQLYAKDPPNT